MLKKLKIMAVAAAVALNSVVPVMAVSAEEMFFTEETVLLQEGGFYDTSTEMSMPLYEAATITAGFEEAVVNACRSFAAEIDVSQYNIHKSNIGDSYFGVLNRHPDLFYVKGTVSYYSNSSGYITKILITYNYDKSTASSMIAAFNKEVNNITSGIDPDWSNAEKALYIHEYLVSEYSYVS